MDPKPNEGPGPTEEGQRTNKAAGKLAGKKTLITGGDNGIGRAVAMLFAEEGAEVAIAYWPAEEQHAQTTKKHVEKNNGKIFLFEAEFSVPKKCMELVENVVKALGGLNILVNVLGFQVTKDDISDISDEQWLYTFSNNIHPVFYLSKYCLPHMKAGDTIINTTSVDAYVGPGPSLDRTATQGAIVSFTRGLSTQLLSKGIRVNAVAPGPIWSALVLANMDEHHRKKFGSTPMGRAGIPEEAASCYVFLASDDSSFISGQTMHPNGGIIVNG